MDWVFVDTSAYYAIFDKTDKNHHFDIHFIQYEKFSVIP